MIPADFLISLDSQRALPGHHASLLANALAQTTALMRGRTRNEAEQELRDRGLTDEVIAAQAPHLVMPGNQPTTLLAYEQLDPRTLGALLALFEHKVYAVSVIWDINAFDQWGVELGKSLARRIHPAVEAAHTRIRRGNGSLTERVSRLLDTSSSDVA